jgi:hypothetical protein
VGWDGRKLSVDLRGVARTLGIAAQQAAEKGRPHVAADAGEAGLPREQKLSATANPAWVAGIARAE